MDTALFRKAVDYCLEDNASHFFMGGWVTHTNCLDPTERPSHNTWLQTLAEQL